jgi:hypothetical protein
MVVFNNKLNNEREENKIMKKFKFNKKAIVLVMIMFVGMFIFTGCSDYNTTDHQQAKQTDNLMKEANREVGLPNITHFYEKKMLKQILELRDDSNLITYAYMQNMNGKFIFLGQCIGFGVPYSTQYTNPEKTVDSDEGEGFTTIQQCDPNGLFSSSGTSATWLMYINPSTGKREIIYSEPNIVVTQSKLPSRLCESWSLPSNY